MLRRRCFPGKESFGAVKGPDRTAPGIAEQNGNSAKKKGYFSICVLYQNKMDFVIVDKFLEQGIYDFEEIYNFVGNPGENRLILLSAKQAIPADDKTNTELIQEAAIKGAASLTLNQTAVGLSYQNINVE